MESDDVVYAGKWKVCNILFRVLNQAGTTEAYLPADLVIWSLEDPFMALSRTVPLIPYRYALTATNRQSNRRERFAANTAAATASSNGCRCPMHFPSGRRPERPPVPPSHSNGKNSRGGERVKRNTTDRSGAFILQVSVGK